MTLKEKIDQAIRKRYADAGRKGGQSRSEKKLAHLQRLAESRKGKAVSV